AHRSAAMGETEEATLRIQNFNLNAATARFLDDQPRIGVERIVFSERAGIKALVYRVLPLDREHRHATEPKLLIERDCLRVVVHDREVHARGATRLVMLRQLANEHFADAGMARLRIDREAPERRSRLGIVEG